ncbi:putative lecithin:cholesterol/phospholipid:diacylglycerol acyltransferase [Helianthus anomalus]
MIYIWTFSWFLISGAPLLGLVQTVEATVSSSIFGLPIPHGTARLMFNSFGSSLWMSPFSYHCTSEKVYSKHFSGGRRKKHSVYQCDDLEYRLNYSGFPTNIISIEILFVVEAYLSFGDKMQANLSNMECGVPTQLSFFAREIAYATFFKAIEDYDPDRKRLLYQLDKPPLKNIFCIYGVDSRTEVGYYFAPSGKPYPDNWIMTDVYEFEG